MPSQPVCPHREAAVRAFKLWVGKSQSAEGEAICILVTPLSVVSEAHNSLGKLQVLLAGQTASAFCASQNVGNVGCALCVHQFIHLCVVWGSKTWVKKWFPVFSICSPKLVFKMGEVCILKKHLEILIVTAGIFSASFHLVPNSNFCAGPIYAA